jgi:hypothetical protein
MQVGLSIVARFRENRRLYHAVSPACKLHLHTGHATDFPDPHSVLCAVIVFPFARGIE